MANVEELERHIEATQADVLEAVRKLKGFAELQSSLDEAGGSVRQGGLTLIAVGKQLHQSAQAMDAAVREFRDAVEAMRKATPEALSNNVDAVLASAERTEQGTMEFQAAMREEIAEQRESLERRIQAVESGLEKTRANAGQNAKSLNDRLDDFESGVRGRQRFTTFLTVLTLLLVAGALALQVNPELISMLPVQ